MYGRLISDFGITYIYMLLLLAGYIVTKIYKRAKINESLYIYLYAHIAGLLFFTFYDDMFFRIISFLIQIVLAGFIGEYYFSRKKFY